MDPRALTLARRRLQRHLFLLSPPSMPVAEVLLVLLVASLLHAQPASSQFCNGTACSDSDALRLCAAPGNRTKCSPRVYVSFPFFTSDQCLHNDSSFVIADCDSSTGENPRWPGFTKYAMTDTRINETFITHLFNPFSFNQTGSSEADNGTSNASNPLDASYGYVNLTWNNNLQEQSRNICEILVSPDQISEYIPSSIDLRIFARAAFHFDPSNIILLFNCTVPQEQKPPNLNRNSSACAAYGRECNQSGDGGSDCYEYSIPSPGQNLSLPNVMNDWGCKRAMFFVRLRPALPVRTWTPGLMRLSWSLQGTDGLGATLEKCANCSSNDGLCSYDSSDNFQCLCGSGCSAKPGNDSHKLIIFITLGIAGVCLILIVVLLIAILFFKKKKAGSAAFYREHNYNLWRKRPSFLSRKPDPDLAREISYNELICATESFTQERILGYGAFGAVYNGVFADGLQVAVKRLHHDNYRRMELFYNEIKVLSSINHPNLVKLYGFCVCEEERELLLVFEYASQGTVSDHIHNGLEPPLSWSLRLNIACETADALSYLHNTVVPPIYHRDVKTANILLDDGFHVKLADFGLSKLVQSRASSHISTSPQGTPGYLDPEYHQCYQLTDKSDVYSLGVVLMELISGKPAVDMTRVQGEINLSAFAVMKVQCGLLEELVDPTLQMEKDPTVERSVKRVVELAFECLHICRDDRPSMRCVAERLAHIRKQHKESAIVVTEKPFPSPGFSLASTDSSYHSSNLSSS